MLVRTLVLELIPLSAALYVAVRYSLAEGETGADDARRGAFQGDAGGAAGIRPATSCCRGCMAAQFAVVALTAVSGVVVLVLTYASLYGFATWGFAAFTRAVGQVVDPVTALILAMKTFFMSLVVAIVPMVTTAPRRPRPRRPRPCRTAAAGAAAVADPADRDRGAGRQLPLKAWPRRPLR